MKFPRRWYLIEDLSSHLSYGLKLLIIWESNALSTTHHLQSDGKIKRVKQVLEQYLWCYFNAEHNNCVEILHMAQSSYNSQDHGSIRMSAFKANYVHDPS